MFELELRDESDPVSPKTGGAFLGDRVRFGNLAEDDGVFIRSLAHRAGPGRPTLGGVDAARVLEAAGYAWILFETVGIGQSETAVFENVDLRVLVLSPEVGDWQQMLKAGYLETAEVIVVNQSDRPSAADWAQELTRNLAVPLPAVATPRVVTTSARSGAGVSELVDLLRQMLERAG